MHSFPNLKRAQTEAVTFLGNPEGGCRSLYAIPGLDYVSHQDIWPYSSTEKLPVFHELFDKFLYYNPSGGKYFINTFDRNVMYFYSKKF